jgi:hypothetical protein
MSKKRTAPARQDDLHPLAEHPEKGERLTEDLQQMARRHGLTTVFALIADEGGLSLAVVSREQGTAGQCDEAVAGALAGMRSAQQAICAGLLEDLLGALEPGSH